MSTPNVQLAFQGGGAKLAAMLPVADAFLTAQARGFINIKAVAGTSAGAICAALVATRADFSKVKTFLVDKGPWWVEKLAPPTARALVEVADKDLDWWGIFKRRAAIRAVLVHGKPIMDGGALDEFFEALLESSTGAKRPRIESCTTALSIIASDIVASRAVTHKQGDLVASLADSCALPIIFRSFDSLSGSHRVDGGLCDNLPVEGLIGDPEAPVFAIFPTNTSVVAAGSKNILTYITSLFAASINHGVTRAKMMVSAPFQFEVLTDLGLLDFDKAIGCLRDKEWYENRKSGALKRIENFAKSFGVVSAPNEARVIDVFDVRQYQLALTDLSDDYASHFEVLRARFQVRVNCDQSYSGEAVVDERESDTVTRITEVKVLTDDASFYRANLIMHDESIIPTVWSAKNLTKGVDIPIRALPLGERTFSGGRAKQCLIQFLCPRKYIEKGDVIEIRSVYHTTSKNDMKLLNAGKNDDFGFTNSQFEKISRAELVLIYPKRLGRLTLLRHEQKCNAGKIEPIIFDKANGEMLEEGFAAVGISVLDLGRDQRLFALVTKH